jgi:hypothetical protein
MAAGQLGNAVLNRNAVFGGPIEIAPITEASRRTGVTRRTKKAAAFLGPPRREAEDDLTAQMMACPPLPQAAV